MGWPMENDCEPWDQWVGDDDLWEEPWDWSEEHGDEEACEWCEPWKPSAMSSGSRELPEPKCWSQWHPWQQVVSKRQLAKRNTGWNRKRGGQYQDYFRKRFKR